MPEPVPSPDDASTPRHLSAQDQILQNYLTDARTFLTTASTDAEIRPVLELHGYDDAAFAEGFRLQGESQSAFDQRQEGLGNKRRMGEGLKVTDHSVRDAYAAFREIARAAFPAQGDRQSLGLTGDVPEGFAKFVTLARASYANAGKDPWKTKITKRGYNAERLKGLSRDLDQLVKAGSAQDQAEGEAVEDTGERDDAYTLLKAYMKELKGTARGALRGKAGMLNKLKL